MNIRDQAIKLIIKKGMESINKNVDLDYVLNSSGGENRTLNFEIIDSQNILTGFTIVREFGKAKMVEITPKTIATLTLRTTKNSFLAICLRKITIEESILYGETDLSGDNWLRDYKIFQPIFKGFGDVLRDVVPSER